MSNKLSSVEHENIMEVVDTEGMDALVKLMHLKVAALGNEILKEDLKKASFANVGVQLAKFQGAQELAYFIEREVKAYKKKSLKS